MKKTILTFLVTFTYASITFGAVWVALDFIYSLSDEHDFNWYSVLFLVVSFLAFIGSCKLNLEFNPSNKWSDIPVSEEEKERIRKEVEQHNEENRS